MKKVIITSIIAIAAIVGYTAMAGTVTGDVNGDGVCNSADVTALYQFILNNDTSKIVNGDQNSDGIINSADVTAVYSIILGTATPDIDDYNINIVYNGTSATVTVAKNISSYITVAVDGAHVNIVADAQLQDSIFYNLSGSTTDGSFYMDGEYKCYVNLTDLSITNPDSAAINIDNGKRIDLIINGTNTLTDATGGAQKACCFINGHTVIAGDGTLNITGNSKHAYFSDEYTTMNSGTINVLNSASDGMHINQYFMMNGGNITINTTGGDGIDVGMTKNVDDTHNGEFILNDGTITVTTSGDAVKGVKCESIMTIAGGTLTSTTSGNAVYDATKADLSSCAAIKCDSTFNMSDGTIYLTSTGSGGKGLNSDGSVKIAGGTFTAITTGAVYEYSSTLDTKAGGVKADGSITITGGTVRVAASSDDARAFNGELGFFTNGGYILGIGGKSSTVSTGYTQKYKYLRNQVITGGNTYTPLVNNAAVGISFAIPTIYNNSAALVVVSTPEVP